MLNLGIKDLSADSNKDYSFDKEKVDSLRKRILDDKTLVSRTDDAFLLSFLRARKFDESDALKYIKRYYDGKLKYPVLFKNFVPSTMTKFLDLKLLGYLENTDGNGRVIIVGICRRWNPAIISIWEAFQGFLLILDALLNEDLVQRNGVVIILDFSHINWRQILHFTPNFLYTAHCCMVGSYPIRYKQIHVIIGRKTAFWFTTTLLAFCPKKLRERIFIHTSDLDSLHKMIEPKYLPSDYGGELAPFNPTHCNEKLQENEQHFIDCETFWNREKLN